MRYLNTKEAAEKWGLKDRTVRELCQNGRVPNVLRSGRSWMIPEDAPRPSTGINRKKEEAAEKLHIYMNPTYCENNNFAHIAPEEEIICKSTELFLHGIFDEAEALVLKMLETCSSPNYLLLAYFTLLLIYRNAKDNEECSNEIYEKVDELLNENPDFLYTRSILQLFTTKSIDVPAIINLPSDLVPLFVYIYTEQRLFDSLEGTSSFSNEALELICASLSESINPCIIVHLHIAICVYYNILNKRELYLHHLEKATSIALPRKWYTPFASYSYTCSWLEIKDMDEDAYNEIQRLANYVIGNYISSGYFKSTLPLSFSSPFEVKVAILLSRGMSNPMIAKTLDISLYKVKETRKNVYKLLGVKNKNELKKLVVSHLKL